MDALIGHSGFVGTTLLRQRRFDACFRSTDIERIRGQRFDTIVCAGIRATKWQANREPDADRLAIQALQAALDDVQCRRFVLISTVDVFERPLGVDEGRRPTRARPMAATGSRPKPGPGSDSPAASSCAFRGSWAPACGRMRCSTSPTAIGSSTSIPVPSSSSTRW